MGTSVLLVFLAPFFAVYLLFAGIFSEFMPQPQAEIVLPYDESQGLVWEYVEQEDYHINLVEEKVEGDEQIFVFESDQSMTAFIYDIFSGDVNSTGLVIDLVFEDQNGNRKTYYHDPAKDNSESFVVYDESECLVMEYTLKPTDPERTYSWYVEEYEDNDHILRRMDKMFIEGGEKNLTFVFMPDDIEELESGETDIGEFEFYAGYYGVGTEHRYLTFGVEEGQLEIVEERYEFY